jgi:hypothetical protein
LEPLWRIISAASPSLQSIPTIILTIDMIPNAKKLMCVSMRLPKEFLISLRAASDQNSSGIDGSFNQIRLTLSLYSHDSKVRD